MQVNIKRIGDYVFYSNTNQFDTQGLYYGEWLLFFNHQHYQYISQKCYEAVSTGLVKWAKHTNPELVESTGHGLLAFKLESSDIQIINDKPVAPKHQALIQWLLQNNMIPINKSGKYNNIRFKVKTDGKGKHTGNAWNGFQLSDFIDLTTGQPL